MQVFSDRLKELRIRQGLTQVEIAEMLHIKQQSYARYENNSGEPSLEMLVKIAQVLDESIEYLLGIE